MSPTWAGAKLREPHRRNDRHDAVDHTSHPDRMDKRFAGPSRLRIIATRMLLGAVTAAGLVAAVSYVRDRTAACDPRLQVPAGFCATVFADDVGPARHIAIAPNGAVYVATSIDGRRTGAIVALRDTNADGVADERATFGSEGGTGIAIAGDRLFFATVNDVFRYTLDSRALVPPTPPEKVVTGMPVLGHAARTIAVHDRRLYLNIGVTSNACERDYERRALEGAYPCRELDISGGIWTFDAMGVGQRATLDHRFATGLRHTMALAVNPVDGKLYGVPHGIDHLDSWWPKSGFTARDAANIPSETLFRIDSGGDYGFPYCMHDGKVGRMIVAPAYSSAPVADKCAKSPMPLATFAAHSAPMALAWVTSDALGPEYRNGMFVALHGSLFHDPEPPRGYSVMFVDSTWQVRPFASARRRLGSVAGRPSGLALSEDGTLLVADDLGRRIWRVRRRR